MVRVVVSGTAQLAWAELYAQTSHEATHAEALVVAKTIVSPDPVEAYQASGEVITSVYDRLIRSEAQDLHKLVGGVVES